MATCARAPGRISKKAHALQMEQGFAHRRAPHPEFLHQVPLRRQFRPGRQIMIADAALQHFGNLLEKLGPLDRDHSGIPVIPVTWRKVFPESTAHGEGLWTASVHIKELIRIRMISASARVGHRGAVGQPLALAEQFIDLVNRPPAVARRTARPERRFEARIF